MHKHTRVSLLLVLLAAMVLGTALSGCSAINTAKQVAEVAKELATKAPDIANKVATKAPDIAKEVATKAPQPGATPAEATTELDNAFDKLLLLAPVHMSSFWVTKTNEQIESSVSYEADVDAAGNQHIKMLMNDEEVELYVVDKALYIKAEGDQYISMGSSDDEGFTFLLAFGGAYLLAFNDLEGATLVGTEAVGPWQTDKYKINMNLASLGVSGAAAGLQGADWKYQGSAWIEKSKGALVRALVNWDYKPAGSAATENYHAEFRASKGNVSEIKAPANAVGIGG